MPRLVKNTLLIATLLFGITSAAQAKESGAPLPRAALVVGSPLPPGPAALALIRKKLAAGYAVLDDDATRKELEVLDRERSPELLVNEFLLEAMQRMRRLAWDEVQRTLDEAEPHVQLLPPTPGGRALLCAMAVRRAHIALLRGDSTAAALALQRGLSADPDFVLDPAQEPPPLVDLFERVREEIRKAPPARLTVVTHPKGATVVLAGVPRGPAPLELTVPAGMAVTIWAIRDGYQPRNVMVGPEGQPARSVEVRLDPWPPLFETRPLVDEIRLGGGVRQTAAQMLARSLGVQSIVLAQVGLGGTPQLNIFGEAPRWPAPPTGLQIFLEEPPKKPRTIPRWVFVLTGLCVGAVVTGVILGSVK